MYAFAFFYHSIMLNDGHGILLFGYDHYAYSNEIREGNLSLILRKKKDLLIMNKLFIVILNLHLNSNG